MRNIKIGDKLQIHCYKHNGSLYRICDEAVVIDINDEYIVCGNYKTRISEKESIDSKYYHSYHTNEAAILYFYKDSWFNIIGQFKEKGTYYYCNIASPYIIDDGLIKYIDYDLDLRIYPDNSFKVLDRNEYRYHKKRMSYGKDIDMIIKKELSNLIELKKKNRGPFDKNILKKHYEKYLNLISNSKK